MTAVEASASASYYAGYWCRLSFVIFGESDTRAVAVPPQTSVELPQTNGGEIHVHSLVIHFRGLQPFSTTGGSYAQANPFSAAAAQPSSTSPISSC